jgi:threonine/homoserine/homoserine lactone efflux protein
MAGLLIFTTFALAGCGFLIYFLVALWRDSRRMRRERELASRLRKKKNKLLTMQPLKASLEESGFRSNIR